MFFFDYFKKRVENTPIRKDQSKCFRYILCCLQCCFGCLGRFTEFINEHAYTQISIKGDGFWTSAWEGYALIVRNLGRFSVLSFIGSMFTFISSFFIGIVSCVIGYFIITEINIFSESLDSCILPVIIFFIIGCFLGSISMSIFGISGDALIY